MRPGNNGGGNPNHDENGRFTSSGNASAGNKNHDEGGEFSERAEAMKLFDIDSKDEENHKKKWYPMTLDGDILDEEGIEADSEEEAYKIAEQKYPGLGDELSVSADDERKQAMEQFDVDSKSEPDNREKPNLDFLNSLDPDDAAIIKKGIEKMFDSYKDDPDIDFTTLNKEWDEELAYTLTGMGIPENKAFDLVDKFYDVAPSWDETVGKKYENDNLEPRTYEILLKATNGNLQETIEVEANSEEEARQKAADELRNRPYVHSSKEIESVKDITDVRKQAQKDFSSLKDDIKQFVEQFPWEEQSKKNLMKIIDQCSTSQEMFWNVLFNFYEQDIQKSMESQFPGSIDKLKELTKRNNELYGKLKSKSSNEWEYDDEEEQGPKETPEQKAEREKQEAEDAEFKKNNPYEDWDENDVGKRWRN